MKKIILILIMCLFITGCDETNKISNIETGGIFKIIEENYNYKICYHRETKVMYIFSTGVYNKGNFTVMVDKEGKPLLYEKEQDDET